MKILFALLLINVSLVSFAQTDTTQDLAFKNLPAEICINGKALEKEIPYIIVNGIQYPNQFRYKVDAAQKMGMGDIPFTNCTTGNKITFASTMMIVWYLYERGWDVVSINSGEYSGYSMTQVLLKRK